MNLHLFHSLAEIILTTFKLLFKYQVEGKLSSVQFVKHNAREFCLLVGSFKIHVIFCGYAYDLFSNKNIVLSAFAMKFEGRDFQGGIGKVHLVLANDSILPILTANIWLQVC